MTSSIKVGNVIVEMPKGYSENISLHPEQKPIKAEKSDTPEPLETQPYIYRPNDPFQASIDEAHAIASITAQHQPWVKKTWFILFVIGPLLSIELGILASILTKPDANRWTTFLTAHAPIIPFWFLYYMIWRRKVKR